MQKQADEEDPFRYYKNFIEAVEKGQCAGLVFTWLQSMMFSHLPKKNDGKQVNDRECFEKHYNMLTDWDGASKLPPQVDVLIESSIVFQQHQIWSAPGKHVVGQYSYEGKDKNIFLFNNKGNIERDPSEIPKMIQSIQGSKITGLAILVGISGNHAIGLYRDTDLQWYMYDPNDKFTTIDAQKIGKPNDEKVAINKIALTLYDKLGFNSILKFEFRQVVIEE